MESVVVTKPLISTLLEKKTLKQIEYQQEKSNGRHELLTITDQNELIELHLTPDFTEITDSRLIMKFEKANELLLIRDTTFALFNDRIEITRDEQTTEFKCSALIFDVCEIERTVVINKQIVKNDTIIKKFNLSRKVLATCYRVIYVSENKPSRAVVREFFVNDELQIVNSDFARVFEDEIVDIKCTQENLIVLFSNRLQALSDKGQEVMKEITEKGAKIYKQSKQFEPLSVENENSELMPLEEEFGPTNNEILRETDEVLDKIHRKLQNPEFSLELSPAGICIAFSRAQRVKYDSSLISLSEQSGITVFELRECDCLVEKELQLENITGECYFEKNWLHIAAKNTVYLSCLNKYEDEPLEIIAEYEINREISCFCMLNGEAAAGATTSGDVLLIQLEAPLSVVNFLQTNGNYSPALGLSESLDDADVRLEKQKELHAQLGMQYFSELNYKAAMKYFTLSRIDPTCVLYFFSDESFPLADASVCKQQIFAEQILCNLDTKTYVLPVFKLNELKQRQNSADLIQDAIIQLQTYLHAWRADFFAEQESTRQLSARQQKMLANVDEALLKSFLLDPRGVDERQVNELLEQDELNVEIESAIRLLSAEYKESLIQFLKNRGKHQQAVELILQGEATNAPLERETAVALRDYLLDVGLGRRQTVAGPAAGNAGGDMGKTATGQATASTAANVTTTAGSAGGNTSTAPDKLLVKLHADLYQCLFYTDPMLFLALFQAPVSRSAIQQDVLQAIDFLDYQENQFFPELFDGAELLDFKAVVIESALSSKNYFTQNYEAVQLKLVEIYIQLVEREAQKIKAFVSQGQQWKDIFVYLEEIIPIQHLKCLYENEQNINFEEFLADLEDELLQREIKTHDGELPALPRALSEDINKMLGKYRKKLSKLVERLENTDYQKFLDVLPKDCFLQDQAVLFLKKYNFELGLSIFSIQLGMPAKAESVAQEIYADSAEASVENRQFDIFLILLKVYIVPVIAPQLPFRKAALSLILKNFGFFPPLETLQVLKTVNFNVADLMPFLKIQMSRAQTAEYELGYIQEILRGKSAHLIDIIRNLKKEKTEVSQTERCMVCAELLKKEIVIFDNGRAVCSKCWVNPQKCEVVKQMKPVAGRAEEDI